MTAINLVIMHNILIFYSLQNLIILFLGYWIINITLLNSYILNKKWQKPSSTLNTFFAKQKAIIPASVLRKKSQKTRIGFGNFYTNDFS